MPCSLGSMERTGEGGGGGASASFRRRRRSAKFRAMACDSLGGASSASMEASTASMASAASALRLRPRRCCILSADRRAPECTASLAPQVLGQPHCHLRQDSTSTSESVSNVSNRELYPRKLFQTVWASGLQLGLYLDPVTSDLPHLLSRSPGPHSSILRPERGRCTKLLHPRQKCHTECAGRLGNRRSDFRLFASDARRQVAGPHKFWTSAAAP